MKNKIVILLLILWIGLGSMVDFQPTAAQSTSEENALLFLPWISRAAEPVWLGPESADVTTIAYDRRVEDRVYLGTWGAGVFVSEDGGLSWRRMSSGLENLYIQRLVVDPQQAGVVYAGTYGSGVYKTTDGGWNWYPINQGLMNGAIVYGLAVDPQQSNRVYASARVINRTEPPWGGVVYRSLDGGMNWQAVLANIAGNTVQDWVYSLAVDPSNSQRVLAASHEHGVYRSLDYGSTWQPANNGISDLSGRAVAFDPRGSIAYFGVWHRTGEFKTLNGGETWYLQSNGLVGTKIYDLVVNPKNADQLLAATFMMNYSDKERGVARSDNGGEMWVKSGLQAYFIYSVAVNPFNGNEALAGTVDNGVFRSTDGGRNWNARNQGLINVTITDLLIDPINPQIWYALVQERGVWRSLDGGSHWEAYNGGLGNTTIYRLGWDAGNPSRILAWTADGWLSVESGGEGNWKMVEAGVVALIPSAHQPLGGWGKAHPPKPGFEDGENEIHSRQSAIEGLSFPESEWRAADLPAGLSVYALLHTPAGIWLAGTSDGIYRREPDENWQPGGLSGQAVLGLAVDPTDGDWIVAATPSRIWWSRDGGRTWQVKEIEVPHVGIRGVWFDRQGGLLVSLGGQGLLRLGLP